MGRIVTHESDVYEQAVRLWLQNMVIGLNLCPFAKRELALGRIRFAVSSASVESELLMDLQAELELLAEEDDIETTLIIVPHALQDFSDFNDFLDLADALLQDMGLEGHYQLASFHPDYRFADTAADDLENYTNRSPYPILHLIDEATLEQRIAAFPDVDRIPDNNISTLRSLGRERVMQMLAACTTGTDNE